MNNLVTQVILTGGVGSRLWPLSRKTEPKQYLKLFEGKSLFEMTLERNKCIVDKVLVVGNMDNHHLSQEIMKNFELNYSFIVESTPRNTAAAIAFAAFDSNPDDILIITPSDHVIDGELEYEQAICRALSLAEDNYLVTFGIKPTKPETGFGYIEFQGENVLAFHEKPNLKKATHFLDNENFYWNSGLFCFKAKIFLAELEKQEPEVYYQSKIAWDANVAGVLDYDLSLNIPSISVDYAVMERSKNIKVVPSHFSWSDLGSFESVYDYLLETGHPVDEFGNIVIGTTKHTSFVGVENCLLVYSPDAFLVLQKENSQDVKQVYQYLEGIDSPLV